MQRTEDLPVVLRRETAHLHRQVESDVGLPEAVTSRADYVALLERLYGFHAMVEALWDTPQWELEWRSMHVNQLDHRRTMQLSGDLAPHVHAADEAMYRAKDGGKGQASH